MALQCYSGKPIPQKGGCTNRQSQLTSFFKNTLEFARTVLVWTRVVYPTSQSLPNGEHWSLVV